MRLFGGEGVNIFKIITGRLSRMSYVNRYSSFPVNRRENVAEHSYWVAVIAHIIALELIEQGERVSVEHVLKYALWHDVSEVVSGDVIRSYKHSNDAIREAMKDADEDNTYQLIRNQDFGSTALEVLSCWKYAKADTTLEGQIVAFADMAAVAFYCREEDRSGNRAIRGVLKEAYETWFSKYHEHPVLGQFIDQMFPGGRFSEMLREECLPAQLMFPMSATHSEGPTAQYDSAGWPSREVPLG